MKANEGARNISDEADDVGDEEFEGNADVADMQINYDKASDNDDVDEDYDFGGVGGGAKNDDQEMLQQQIMHSSIARDEWMLEVERVAHKLKINKTGIDGKEWRAHMDQTKKYHESVKQSLPEVRGKLERLSEDVSRALEKISKKEQVLTRSFQGMTGNYRAHSDNLKDI
jgi:estrogen-related receptor beta like 1